MASGYGSKIYKKSNRILNIKYFIIFAVLILIIFFFISSSKKKSEKVLSKSDNSKKEIYSKKVVEKNNNSDFYSKTDNTLNEELDFIKEESNKNTENFIRVKKINYLEIEKVADGYFSSGSYNKAISQYQMGLEGKESLIAKIGVCYYKLSLYKKAIELLTVAKNRGFYPFLTRKFLAFSFYKSNELDKSMENALEAVDLRKDIEMESLIAKLKREKIVMSEYKDQSSGKFTIQFSRIEHSDIRIVVLDLLKEAYREIGKKLGIYPDEKIVVILYNEKTFFDVTRAPGWAGGLYDGKIRIPIAGVEDNIKMLKRVVFHEYTHVLVSLITKQCPLWLNEGLAEYFSEGNMDKIGQIIPLEFLEKRFPSDNQKSVYIAYLESYSVVSYIAERYGVFKLKELLLELNNNSIDKAFETVFHMSYSNFLKKWGKNEE